MMDAYLWIIVSVIGFFYKDYIINSKQSQVKAAVSFAAYNSSCLALVSRLRGKCPSLAAPHLYA